MEQTINKNGIAINYEGVNDSLSLLELRFWLNGSELPRGMSKKKKRFVIFLNVLERY